VHPGFCPAELAAARSGRPLMHDFCTISSRSAHALAIDREALRAAALGDLWWPLYKPSLARPRLAAGPRALGAAGEGQPRHSVCWPRRTGPPETGQPARLATSPNDQVEHAQPGVVGNSTTRLQDGRIVTPARLPGAELGPGLINRDTGIRTCAPSSRRSALPSCATSVWKSLGDQSTLPLTFETPSLGSPAVCSKPSGCVSKASERERIGAVADLLYPTWRLNITVCQEPVAPNTSVNCFATGTATFLIMGRAAPAWPLLATSTSTRACAPLKCEATAAGLGRRRGHGFGLSHVVITSVIADDLDDGGASQSFLHPAGARALPRHHH